MIMLKIKLTMLHIFCFTNIIKVITKMPRDPGSFDNNVYKCQHFEPN